MATSSIAGSPVSQVTSYDLPDYITSPSTDISGFIKDYYASMINPQTGMVGGYGQNRVAGITPIQQSVLGQVNNAVGAWGDLFGQGTDLMTQAGQRVGTLGQYDPNEMQRHLNPYLTGVLSQIEQLGNRNLTENVLPNVNSTFVGSGQFGSTRNADFTNRALRDNQEAISNAQGTAMNQAYGQAAQDYLGWNTAGLNTVGTLGTLGQNIGQTALAGGAQNWNDLTNAFNIGAADRAITQEGLTADYEDWINRWKQPLDATNTLSGILTQLKSGVQPTQFSVKTQSSDPNAAWYDVIERILGQVMTPSGG